MAVAGLVRLEGQGKVERWGFEDPACGEKRSLQWSEKKRKKEENITLLVCLQMQAMVAVGVGAKEKRQQQCGGLCAPRWGCSCPSCIGCGGGPHTVVAVIHLLSLWPIVMS